MCIQPQTEYKHIEFCRILVEIPVLGFWISDLGFLVSLCNATHSYSGAYDKRFRQPGRWRMTYNAVLGQRYQQHAARCSTGAGVASAALPTTVVIPVHT